MNNDFWDEGKEITKNIAFGVTRGILVVILLVILFGGIAFGYKMFAVEANHEIFKNSTAYTEAAAEFLAKSYREYNQAKAEDEKAAIMDYVVKRYPNLDLDKIENYDLENFYRQCLRGGQ